MLDIYTHPLTKFTIFTFIDLFYVGPGIDNCINCAKEMALEDGRCVTSCSSEYYFALPKANGFKTCKR